MKVWNHYIIWKTRNGQQLWDGPYASAGVAQGHLNTMLGPRETGFGKVLRVSEEAETT
jgi:hypothetical protein